ncbi:hypothetical protein ABE237_17040 [Brevibacillus formosus]|uniref:hypothetical protein n=1 Tax=Brevibacillus TaxID=55080 RepID=UPI001E56A1A7|nr:MULTISPECIES: hypothetical protein [Brevibacillus]MED1946277.1 hypothetical protein [Brevibacillus formosus]MED1998801.1 hypothetical protein [Brevibacillus formosus]MED2084142.1 hypothetical protein [Brevibacillus formosus]
MVRIDNNFNFQTVPSYRDSLTSVNSVQDKYKTGKETKLQVPSNNVDTVEISNDAQLMLRSTRSAAYSSPWKDVEAIVSDWYEIGKQWASDAADFAVEAGKAGLDFLVLDDVKTLFDPKSSNTDKGLAALSLFPAGKAIKGMKLLKKFDEDVAKFVDRTLSGKVKVGKYYVESRIHEDSLLVREAEKAMKDSRIQKDADALLRRYLEGNNNPGIENNNIFGDIFELRSRKGARVYLRKSGDTVEVLAKSDKHNQKDVINRLRKLYD